MSVPEGALREDAEAEITLANLAPGAPMRVTKSLGFIGDNPLGASPSRGGSWNAPDALLPDHEHGMGSSYGSGYGSFGRSGYRGSSGHIGASTRRPR